MTDDRSSLRGQLLDAERQFHELMPVKDSYSKLFFRSILWFAVFSLGYLLVTSL
jgi:hypothetical protein